MIETLLFAVAALVLTVAVSMIFAVIPLLLRLHRLLRDDARRDAARRWSMFEGDDA